MIGTYRKGDWVQVGNFPPDQVINMRLRGSRQNQRIEYLLGRSRGQWIPGYRVRTAAPLGMNPLLPQEIDMLRAHDVLGPAHPEFMRRNPCIMGYDAVVMQNPEYNGLHLSEGNAKIGRMWNFNLQPGRPAENGGSCPGATDWCRAFCYASKGQSRMQWWRWKHNQDQTARPDFGARMHDTLNGLRGDKLMRVHVGGDLHTTKYVEDWIRLAQAHKNWTFYSYTRSWRPEAEQFSPGINKAVTYLASGKVPNFYLRASTDQASGPPPKGWLEAGVDGTYTSNRPTLCPNLNDAVTLKRAENAKAPEWQIDLVKAFHFKPAKHLASLFFPKENIKDGTLKVMAVHDKYSINCNECKLCWKLKAPLYFKMH